MLGTAKNNGLLRNENTKGVILMQKGRKMAEDGKDCNGRIGNDDFEKLAIFFKKHER